MSLTEFLLARIAEDEARVRGITSGADPDFFWGPDRIRAECEAKRRIVVDLQPGEGEGDYYQGQDFLHERVLMMLALPYADHPDYREEWKP